MGLKQRLERAGDAGPWLRIVLMWRWRGAGGEGNGMAFGGAVQMRVLISRMLAQRYSEAKKTNGEIGLTMLSPDKRRMLRMKKPKCSL